MSEQTVADNILSTIGDGLKNAFTAITAKYVELDISTVLTEIATDATMAATQIGTNLEAMVAGSQAKQLQQMAAAASVGWVEQRDTHR